jgi:quercetin dioxygenase-like cupin family protein
MKNVFAAALVAALAGVAFNAFAADAPAPAAAAPLAAKVAAKPVKKTAILIPAADVKWESMAGAPEGGPQFAFVLGSMTGKTPASFFLKMPVGASSGLHTHTSDYQATVISGTVTDQLEGEADDTAKPMGPGSWWWQPAKEKHLNRCVSSEPCVVFVAVNGPFSFAPATATVVVAKPAAAAKGKAATTTTTPATTAPATK